MSASALATVQRTLADYAERGVFRSLDGGRLLAGATQFTFTWQSNRPLRCVVAPPVLTLRNFLPGIAARSDLYLDLRALVARMGEPALPEHRGIDSTRALARTSITNQRLSIAIESLDGDYVYATRKLMLAAHEVWLRLQSDWVHYLWDELAVPME